ncbi:MAG TPA: hypothetical protein VFA58_04185 [Chthoniobacterales bacterium]|nr:hypothetical protein [Chthoniobacterales bacterium]
MWTVQKRYFRKPGIQIVALLSAFFVISSVHAQSSNAFGVIASGQTSHAGSGTGSGALQDPTLTSTSHGTASFISPAGQTTAELNGASPASPFTLSSAVLSSQGFTYAAPGAASAITSLPNEFAITDNGSFGLFDMFRTTVPCDPLGRLVPGGTMDIRGANHFEGNLAPKWILFRQSRCPLTVSVSTQMTVGDDPYYFGHHYGWIAEGVNIRVPLSFVPRQFGKWSAGTGADLCYYGTTTTEFMNSLALQLPKVGGSFRVEF